MTKQQAAKKLVWAGTNWQIGDLELAENGTYRLAYPELANLIWDNVRLAHQYATGIEPKFSAPERIYYARLLDANAKPTGRVMILAVFPTITLWSGVINLDGGASENSERLGYIIRNVKKTQIDPDFIATYRSAK